MLRQIAQKLAQRGESVVWLTKGAGSAGGFSRDISSGFPVRAPLHIEEETHCRQRTIVVLEDKMPSLAPDAWVAPNAVVVGDVDLGDGVSALHPSCRFPLRSTLQLNPSLHALPLSPR